MNYVMKYSVRLSFVWLTVGLKCITFWLLFIKKWHLF